MLTDHKIGALVQMSISILTVSSGLSLYTLAYKRSLNPLFGGTSTEQYLGHVVRCSVALGIFMPKLPASRILLILATLVLISSHSAYWTSVFAARFCGPVVGSLVPHTLALAPVTFLSVSLTMRINPSITVIVVALNALQPHFVPDMLVRNFSLDIQKDHTFFLLGLLTYAAWTCVKTIAIKAAKGAFRVRNGRRTVNIVKRYFPLLLPATLFLFPTMRSPRVHEFPYYNPKHPLRILSSQESVTGVIVVGELLDMPQRDVPNMLHSLRYLRASHSLLGGVWIGDLVATLDDASPRTDASGVPLGDSIYSTFVLQEASRLINRTSRCQHDCKQEALIIGVGAGISADALARHGISTTLVEIDPAVYNAARKYFGLKHPGDDRVFLEDARGWVHKRVATQLATSDVVKKFDLIIHDCFSGGGVPKDLFSLEFWDELKAIMTTSGVIAINFAGKLGSRSSQAVMTTLLKAFDHCRAFHDNFGPISEQDVQDKFVNMVIFCSLSPINIRQAVEGDYLHSPLRRYVLSSLEEREVSISQIRGSSFQSEEAEEMFLLTEMNNKLDEWQRHEAVGHWRIMREIFPDIVWETY